MTRRMIAAVRNPLTSVLGHCTGRRLMPRRGDKAERSGSRMRPPSEFDAAAVFAACAETGRVSVSPRKTCARVSSSRS